MNNLRKGLEVIGMFGKTAAPTEKTYTQEEVEKLIDQAIAFAMTQTTATPSPVEYDVAMLRQYALFTAMNFNVQIAGSRGTPTMEQVILDASKILEYLGHGNELIPSAAAYQGVMAATADRMKQTGTKPDGYI